MTRLLQKGYLLTHMKKTSSLFVKRVTEFLNDRIDEQFGAHLVNQGFRFVSIGFLKGHIQDFP